MDFNKLNAKSIDDLKKIYQKSNNDNYKSIVKKIIRYKQKEEDIIDDIIKDMNNGEKKDITVNDRLNSRLNNEFELRMQTNNNKENDTTTNSVIKRKPRNTPASRLIR